MTDLNPTFLGIHLTTSIDDAGNPTIIHHCAVVDAIATTVGYIELPDSISLTNFRTLLLQHQPSEAVLFTLHGDEIEEGLIDAITAELQASRCNITRHVISANAAANPSKSIEIITQSLIPLPAKKAQQQDTSSTTTTTTTSTTTKRNTADSHSIFPVEQIHESHLLFNTIATGEHPLYGTNRALVMNMLGHLLHQFVILPTQRQIEKQETLSASTTQRDQKSLARMSLYEKDLPLQYLFKLLTISPVMKIDHTTLSSLGIIKAPTDTVKNMSLQGLLSNCQTHFGNRLLSHWIRNPLIDIYAINQRQLTTAAFVTNPSTLKDVQLALRGVGDIEKVLTKLNKYYARITSPKAAKVDLSSDIIKELLQLYYFVGKVSTIVHNLSTMPFEPIPSSRPEGAAGEDVAVCEDDLYVDTVYELPAEEEDEQQEQQNEDGAQPQQPRTTTIRSLSYPNLLQASVHLEPEQFVNINFTRQLSLHLQQLAKFQAMILQSVDLSAISRFEYLINPSLTDSLQEISDRKEKVMKAMHRVHTEVCSDLGVDKTKVKLNHTAANQIGYFLRVTRKEETLIRGKSTYSTIETRKDGVRFTTSNLQKLSAEYTTQIKLYKQLQLEICVALLQSASTYFQDFAKIVNIIAELDVLTSFASVATQASNPYIRPVIISPTTNLMIGPKDDIAELQHKQRREQEQHQTANTTLNNSHILLKQARHPCLEVQPGVTYIPSDVELVHNKKELQIITGPNMGGKSSYLRTVALIALMAQLGCYVPCTSASMHIVDCILARVGAGDQQLQGVSTFMKEMMETAQILNNATSNSLILIDELGRGTSTYDGFGLAWGIAEYLATKVHSYTLFATHFHELTAMSHIIPTVCNKHVSALTSTNQITMLYQIKDGYCDRSFGIHVAQIANFPDEVIRLAQEKARVLEQYGNSSVGSDAVVTITNPNAKKDDLMGEEKKEDAMSDDASSQPSDLLEIDLAMLTPALQDELIDRILKIKDADPEKLAKLRLDVLSKLVPQQ